jgi:ribonucleoside-diphosphate reductase beta chain
MSILKNRDHYKPFEYPEAYDHWLNQVNAIWLPFEVPMTKDIADYNTKLSSGERYLLSHLLQSFTQTEVHVNEYWTQYVAPSFPKPEIQMMCSMFGAFETIHTVGYSYLNDSLGLDDYTAFLEDETAVAKLQRLKKVKGKTKKDIARSLAIFSGCTEGVNLFSSFAILMNFSRFNLMDGLETIVSWSIRDESLHSTAGCWLFRTLIEENPEIFDDELKKDIYDAFRLTIKLEDDFIDKAFAEGDVRGLCKEDIKAFIRERANSKLHDLGLKANWKNIDKKRLDNMKWFSEIDNQWTDFFAKKVVDYFRSGYNVDNLFEGFNPDEIF